MQFQEDAYARSEILSPRFAGSVVAAVEKPVLSRPPLKDPPPSRLQIAVFTAFMSGGMSTFMSLYNTILHRGADFTVAAWLGVFVCIWPVAFILGSTVSAYLVDRILMPTLDPKVKQPWVSKHLYSICKVCTMVPMMSAVSRVVLNGFTMSPEAFVAAWAIGCVQSLFVALGLNIFVVAPVVLRLYQRIFHAAFYRVF